MRQRRIRPAAIRLEAMGACQLRCPSCPTTTGAIRPTIGSGYLRLEDFKCLIESSPFVRKVELSNYGEVFLNPKLLQIMRYAHQRGIELTAMNGVNLNTVKDEVLEGLVEYQFKGLSCSIDGASQETYSIYRVRGDFEKVIENIRKINEHKRRRGSALPHLTWQFVVFGHNEHEIQKARALCRELGMTFNPKISWDDEFSPIKDKAFVLRETGLQATRSEYREQTGEICGRVICRQLWRSPQINWDGKVLGCCRNFWGDFGGNAFRDGLEAAVNNEKIGYARDMLRGRRGPRDDIPCTTCEIYDQMRVEGAFVADVTSEAPAFLLRARELLSRHARLNKFAQALYRNLGLREVLHRLLSRRRARSMR